MYEVESALKSMESYTLLLKGAPGTGKTTYAITLLEKLCKGDGKGVYISTRIDPTVLYKEFPWIEEHVPKKSIIDATQSEFSEAEFQIMYNDFTSFLRSVYSVVAEEDITILIIDSWDAVSFQIEKESRDRLDTSMLDIARKTKTHLVLLSEDAGERRLDYLVDGVLRFEKKRVEDKIVRLVHIDKMKRFQLPRSNYFFSLEGGKFTYFEPTGLGLGSGRHKVVAEKEKEKKRGLYSTGIEDLDSVIGGYPRGSFVLLELTDDSISWCYRPFLFHTISDFLLKGRGVIYMPEDGSYSSSVKKLISDYVDEKVIDKNLRMPTVSESESEDPCLFKIEEGETLKEYFGKHLEVYKGLKKPVLHVIGLTRLNIHSEDDVREMVSEAVSWVRTTNDVLVGVLKPSAKLKNEICELADLHLRFVPLDGTLNFYGVKPHTVLYNISPLSLAEEEKEYHQLKLTPLV